MSSISNKLSAHLYKTSICNSQSVSEAWLLLNAFISFYSHLPLLSAEKKKEERVKLLKCFFNQSLHRFQIWNEKSSELSQAYFIVTNDLLTLSWYSHLQGWFHQLENYFQGTICLSCIPIYNFACNSHARCSIQICLSNWLKFASFAEWHWKLWYHSLVGLKHISIHQYMIQRY